MRIGGGAVQFADMKLYQIETGIKIPSAVPAPKAAATSIVSVMLTVLEKGQSFLITDANEAARALRTLRDKSRRDRKKKDGSEFVSRPVGNGLRIWRVK